MNTTRHLWGGITLAAALLLVLASLQACQPAAPQPTGTQITGTFSPSDEEFEDPPNTVFWMEGETLHGRNMIFIFNSVYTDRRLIGRMIVTSNGDGAWVKGLGIAGHFRGNVLIWDSNNKVSWDGNFEGQSDKDGNESGKMTLQGQGDCAGLTANLTFTRTLVTRPPYTSSGVIIEGK